MCIDGGHPRGKALDNHKKAIVPENLSEGLEFLPQIWKLEPGDLKITGAMVSSLIEQLKAIFVKVDSS